MGRRLVILPVAVLLTTAATADDPSYHADNARLAHATPDYPRARTLVQESIYGEAGSTPFEAVQRIYRLAAPSTQRRVLSFYRRRLGPLWHQKGSACLTSGRRAVAVLLYAPRRRLGVVIDSRGASYCREHVANIGLLLQLGYPDKRETAAPNSLAQTQRRADLADLATCLRLRPRCQCCDDLVAVKRQSRDETSDTRVAQPA